MSDIVNEAVVVLNEKLAGSDFDGTAKFDIEGEGTVMMDDTNPTSAFMTGKLKIDGDMGMAMKLAAVLG